MKIRFSATEETLAQRVSLFTTLALEVNRCNQHGYRLREYPLLDKDGICEGVCQTWRNDSGELSVTLKLDYQYVKPRYNRAKPDLSGLSPDMARTIRFIDMLRDYNV